MKVAVCIKQVPVLSRMQFDYESKTIVREGVPLEVNSFDMLAVGRAVELVKEQGGELVVVTMGPPQASNALIQCLALGADRALHLTDRAMAGADTLATARTLALALQKDEYQLVLCGRNSTDAETGQVGPELAEYLGIPYVGNVRKLDYESQGNSLLVERETDDGYELIRCPLPALVSVCEGISEERFPNRQQMLAATENPAIEEITAAQISPDLSQLGAAGSPTWVTEIQLVEPSRRGEIIEEEDPQLAAQRVVTGLDLGAAPSSTSITQQWNRYADEAGAAIWVVADHAGSELRRSSFEILGKARELAETTHGQVGAVLLGPDAQDQIDLLAAYGADKVITLDITKLGHPTGGGCASVLAEAIKSRQPYAVLFSSTANGRDLASRLAARLELGLTGDCIDLGINEEREMVQYKPALGGNVVAPILSKTMPYLATLRPGLLSPIEPSQSAACEVEHLNLPDVLAPDFELLEVHIQEDARGLELETAQVVIGVGMGIGGPENLPVIYKLANVLGAAVASTRNVTDAGWLPRQTQVGLTGRAISPNLYIAVGIRGDFNHMVGLQKAGTIIAISNNPNPRRSPILQGADFSIIGDWEVYLAPLVEALRPLLA